MWAGVAVGVSSPRWYRRTMIPRRERPLAHVVFPRSLSGGMHGVFARRFPPLSMVVVAALVQREGWDVELIDQNHQGPSAEVPDAVFIVSWTGLAVAGYRTAADYRARGVPVIMGGVHPSMMPGEALRHADAIVVGEAEEVMPTLVRDLGAGSLQRVYHGGWLGMDAVPDVRDYGHLYRHFPTKQYRPTHSMQTTRGCRFNCDFCSVIRINGRGSRHMDPARVVEELRYRLTLPPRIPGEQFLFFVDDDIAADIDYTGNLLEALASADLPFRFGAQASIGLARHPDLVELARAAKLKTIFVGFESVSRDALVEANKKNRPHEYGELVRRLHTGGMAVEGGFIFGFDGDRPDVFDETVDFVHRMGVDGAHFTILTPYPGTGTFARLYREGRIFDTDWSHYMGYRTVFQPAAMTPAELDAGLARAYARFYSARYRWERLRRGAGYFDRPQLLAQALINSTWSGSYRMGLDHTRPPQYEADPADLEDLALTSAAPAPDAITTALGHLHAELAPASGPGSAVPVHLATRA